VQTVFEPQEVEMNYSRDDTGVPHLVLQTTKFLYEKGLREMGIFRIPANHENLNNYLKLFQSNENIDLSCEKGFDCHLAACLLKAYFRTLDHPLFPNEHYPSLLLVSKIDSEDEQVTVIKDLLNTYVKMEDYNTLIHVFHLLFAIASKNEENLMSPRNIGICWSPTLFHQGNEAEDLIIFMIENHEKIFGKLDINNMTKVNVKSFNHNKVNSIVQKQKTIKRQSDMPRRNSTISLLEGKQLSDKENEKIMVRTRFLSRTKTLQQKNNKPIPNKDKVKKKKKPKPEGDGVELEEPETEPEPETVPDPDLPLEKETVHFQEDIKEDKDEDEDDEEKKKKKQGKKERKAFL